VGVLEIALAWVLAQEPWIVSIPGTTSSTGWKNIGAADVVLTPDDLREIEEANQRSNALLRSRELGDCPKELEVDRGRLIDARLFSPKRC
jgi:diketogulonate reductase-like aldo/keto reductase